MPPIPTQPFLGFRLAACGVAEFINAAIALAAARASAPVYSAPDAETMPASLQPFCIAYLNAATVNMAFADAAHARRLARFDSLYADGMAVVWAARLRGAKIPERVNAGDFTPEFMRRMAAGKLKLALIGGRPARNGAPSEAEAAAAIFKQWAPGLDVALTEHGYGKVPDDAAAGGGEALLARIEAADPDIIMLGMGSPRQEIAALAWSASGRPRVWWCVGALFEYCAGTRARAPRWVRRIGMEWAVRLALEPSRLWRRYLIGNPLFVLRALRGAPPRGLAPAESAGEGRA